MTDIDLTHACQAAVVRPGDTLIVGLSGSFTAERTQELANRLKERLPEGVEVGVMDNVQQFLVVRP